MAHLGRMEVCIRALDLRADGALIDEALALHARVLGPMSRQRFDDYMRSRRRRLLLAAFSEERLIGYKFGHQDRPGRFYSWIGGVDPQFERQGVARALMDRQHQTVRRWGFTTVRTHTRNRHRRMLILNLRYGFDIIGTFVEPRGETRIMLEKKL